MIYLKAFLVLLLSSVNCISQTQDSALYQTWYLHSYATDLGPTDFYYGEEVPKMTIFEDLSFYATDNCWKLTGNFEVESAISPFEFGLVTLDYDKECVLDGTTGYVLEQMFEFNELMNTYLNVYNSGDDLFIETYPGSGPSFKNGITLSVSDKQLNQIIVSPNPVSETLKISSSEIQLSSIEILSLQGKVLTTEIDNLQEINLSHLSSGVYFIKLISEENSVIKKIIKT